MAGFDSGFEQGPEDDPFAGSEESFGLSEEERQAAEQANDAAMEAEAPGAAQAVAEPPVVDREGQPVETTADGSPAAAQGAGVDPEQPEQAASEAAAAPIAQAEKAEPPEAPEVEAAHEEQAEVEATQVESEAAVAAASQETAASEAAVEEAQASADPPEPEASPSSEEPGAVAGDESAGEDAGGGSAEAPTEGKGKRRYLLFTPEGDGRFREVEWYEKGGKSVPKGTAGAKKQKVLLARGQEDALRFGHEVLGAPQEGSSLVAVAASYFQVRKVKPDAVPVRQRLKIS